MVYLTRHHTVASIEIDGKEVVFIAGVLDCPNEPEAFGLHFQTPHWVLLPEVGRYRVALADGRTWVATGRELHPNPWCHDIVHGGGTAGFDRLVSGREYWLAARSQAAVGAGTVAPGLLRDVRHPDDAGA